MRATFQEFYRLLSDNSFESKRTMILRWRPERPKLLAAMKEGKGRHTKLRNVGVGTVLSHNRELDNVHWVNELREDGVRVSSRTLTNKARQVAVEAEVHDFYASDKWAAGFKRRHHFSLRKPTRQSQICPADVNMIAAALVAIVEATIRYY
jgi:hypothetical protein